MSSLRGQSAKQLLLQLTPCESHWCGSNIWTNGLREGGISKAEGRQESTKFFNLVDLEIFRTDVFNTWQPTELSCRWKVHYKVMKEFYAQFNFLVHFFFLSISYTENVDCLCSGNHSKPFSRDRRFRKAGLLTSVFGLSCNCWLLKGSVNLIYLPCPHQCFNHLPSAARTLTLKHLQHSGRQEQTEI